MSKFWIILSHTYMTRIKSRTFLISTGITLLLFFGLANIQSIIEMFSDDSIQTVVVVDESGELYEPLKESMETTNENIELINTEESVEEVKKGIQNNDYESLIILKLNENMMPEASYYANTITEFGVQSEVEQQLQQLKIAIATNLAGIDQLTIDEILTPVSFHTFALDEHAKTDDELNQARGIVYIMLFLLYMAVALYGQMIATEVATEKSSRVMEILISSASPVTHMFAKILGIALLGLTQVTLFIVVGYGLIVSKQNELTGSFFEFFGIQNTSPAIYIYAIVFFLLGYLLYATLAAMLGSLVSRVEDVQQLVMPMIFLIMIAFFISVFGIGMPDSKFVTISSYIPVFTPMVMFLRVGMLNIPAWEVILGISILVVAIILLGVLGARVYKGGVLMYSRSSLLKDFRKAMALSKKE